MGLTLGACRQEVDGTRDALGAVLHQHEPKPVYLEL